jgi:hypothetical protein
LATETADSSGGCSGWINEAERDPALRRRQKRQDAIDLRSAAASAAAQQRKQASEVERILYLMETYKDAVDAEKAVTK